MGRQGRARSAVFGIHSPPSTLHDEHIRRLQVAVDDARRVQRRDRVAELCERRPQPLQSKMTDMDSGPVIYSGSGGQRHFFPPLPRGRGRGEQEALAG